MSMERLRVLYAEDNLQDADLTLAHFEEHAPELVMEVVELGSTCLERLEQGNYDVLLLDHRLPDMDGTDVLKALALKQIPIPVVVVTGIGDESLVVQVLRLGACDYVPKNGKYLESLPTVLKNAVQHYANVQQCRRIRGEGQWRMLYAERHPADVDLTVAHFSEVGVP